MYRIHQDLICVRGRHPWLVTARTTAVSLTNTSYVYRAHPAQVHGSLRAELNVADRPLEERSSLQAASRVANAGLPRHLHGVGSRPFRSRQAVHRRALPVAGRLPVHALVRPRHIDVPVDHGEGHRLQAAGSRAGGCGDDVEDRVGGDHRVRVDGGEPGH